ncbi:MAG: hypothetical protein O3B13_16395 [Planctomycetota bacterium]|nr:hypothetical protein [Planctomycetota bacterium]
MRSRLDWRRTPEQLSLGDYWNTPHTNVLFPGAYDYRYTFSRVSIASISGTGKPLRDEATSD